MMNSLRRQNIINVLQATGEKMGTDGITDVRWRTEITYDSWTSENRVNWCSCGTESDRMSNAMTGKKAHEDLG
jgi:hypothetical protein